MLERVLDRILGLESRREGLGALFGAVVLTAGLQLINLIL